jgi:hypothetical protein
VPSAVGNVNVELTDVLAISGVITFAAVKFVTLGELVKLRLPLISV